MSGKSRNLFRMVQTKKEVCKPRKIDNVILSKSLQVRNKRPESRYRPVKKPTQHYVPN